MERPLPERVNAASKLTHAPDSVQAPGAEVRGAVWTEMDQDSGVWTIPASRMKTAREQRVPLCGRALGSLKAARNLGDGKNPVVFVNERGRTLYGKRLNRLLRKRGIAAGVTRQALSELLNGRTGVSVEMAIRLSKAFGSTPETWLGMRMAHDLWQVRGRAGEIAVERFVAA